MAAGQLRSSAIRHGGAVVAWGESDPAQEGVIQGSAGVKSIAAGPGNPPRVFAL